MACHNNAIIIITGFLDLYFMNNHAVNWLQLVTIDWNWLQLIKTGNYWLKLVTTD